jgi:histidine triad (HIT) family protein
MTTNCIFCQIIAGKSPAHVLYKDDTVTAFRDTHPIAPVHLLIVPNQHIASVNDLTENDEILMGHLFSVARQLAAQHGIAQSGFRLMVNTGPHSGQAVFHLHIHLLGGQRLRIPMA